MAGPGDVEDRGPSGDGSDGGDGLGPCGVAGGGDSGGLGGQRGASGVEWSGSLDSGGGPGGGSGDASGRIPLGAEHETGGGADKSCQGGSSSASEHASKVLLFPFSPS
jgi:hypothetical protein